MTAYISFWGCPGFVRFSRGTLRNTVFCSVLNWAKSESEHTEDTSLYILEADMYSCFLDYAEH